MNFLLDFEGTKNDLTRAFIMMIFLEKIYKIKFLKNNLQSINFIELKFSYTCHLINSFIFVNNT